MGSLIVTGTGTNVGKTHVSAILVSLFAQAGKRTAYYKPYQSGVYHDGKRHVIPDVDFIKRHSPLSASDIHVTYALTPPLSPFHAAQAMGVAVTSTEVARTAASLSTAYDSLVIEGAGGLYTPILSNYFFIDLFKELAMPVVLVADASLGAINSTLLSCEALCHHGIKIALVVLNRTRTDDDGSESHACSFLSDQIKPTPVFLLPHMSGRLPIREQLSSLDCSLMVSLA
ncbi:MAG: dethiobiotin synthase [Spirochaetota bacterium]